LIEDATCTSTGLYSVKITLIGVKNLQAGDAFTLSVKNVKNAPSMRPTSSFTNMVFRDKNNFELTEFSKSIII
jgi:hypothetical protein